MLTPEQLFTQIWEQLTTQWSRIQTFRTLGQSGLPFAASKIHEQHTAFVRSLVSDPEMSKMLVDPGAYVRDGHAAKAPHKMTQHAIHTFESSLDAASLVFGHSILDAALLDCCKVCSMVAPADWLPQLRDRKVPLADVEGHSFHELLVKLIEAQIQTLERESLIKKADRVFQLCPPKEPFSGLHGFKFDRDRLLALDALRHDIVHSAGPTLRLPKGNEDLEFLRNSGLYLWILVHKRHSLKIDINHIRDDISMGLTK